MQYIGRDATLQKVLRYSKWLASHICGILCVCILVAQRVSQIDYLRCLDPGMFTLNYMNVITSMLNWCVSSTTIISLAQH